MNTGRYTKAILATFLAAGTAVITALQNDGKVDGLEWLGLIAALLTGAAVWGVRNQSAGVGLWAKAIVTALGSAVTGLTTALANNTGVGLGELLDKVTADEWMTLIMAVFNGVLVAVAPNAAVSDDPPQPGGDPVAEEAAEGEDEWNEDDEEDGPDLLPSDKPADYPERNDGLLDDGPVVR